MDHNEKIVESCGKMHKVESCQECECYDVCLHVPVNIRSLKAQLDEAVELLEECRYHLQGTVTSGYIELSERVGTFATKHKG